MVCSWSKGTSLLRKGYNWSIQVVLRSVEETRTIWPLYNPLKSMAIHFPISKNTEVSMEWVITLKAVHMRHFNVFMYLWHIWSSLSLHLARVCFMGAAMQQALLTDLSSRLQLWTGRWVSGLTHCLGLIANVWWFVCSFAVIWFAATGCLYSTGHLAKQCTGSISSATAVVPLLKFSLELLRPHMQIVSQILGVWFLLPQFVL